MKILKDSFIYILGEILSKMMPFFLLPYLSRKLGVVGYGELSYYQTYFAFFMIFIGFSQDKAIARYFYIYGKRSIHLILNSSYIYTTIMGIIICSICYLFKSQILIYISLAVIFQTYIYTLLSILQCQKRSISYTLIQLSTSMLSFITTILLFEIFKDNLVEKRFIAILISNCSIFVITYFLLNKNKKVFSIHNYKKGIAYLLIFGIPLILTDLNGFIRGEIDKYFIFHKYNQSELGIYSMGLNLSLILTYITFAINKAITPYFFEALSNKKILFKQLYRWTLYFICLLPIFISITYIFPEKILLFFVGDKFTGIKYFFNIFIISELLLLPILIFTNYLIFFKRNKYIAITSIITLFIYLISFFISLNISIYYIPFSRVISAIFTLILLLFFCKKITNQQGKL